MVVAATIFAAMFLVLFLPAFTVLSTFIYYVVVPFRVFSRAEPRRKTVPVSCGVQFFLPDKEDE